MRALVISGGGSKGAFAGGVSQYLIEELQNKYDLYLGTSTGSLLISHLALNNTQKIKDIFTSVNQKSVFNNCPFTIKKLKHGQMEIAINHFNVFKNIILGRKTFGESKNLRKLISKVLSFEEFEELQKSAKEIIVTVSNFSLNQVEYKSINDFEYHDFCDWIWISCNYTPFMSLVNKEGCEYADGGFGSMVPIEEAIKRGATVVDVIILETEVAHLSRMPSRNAFSLITTMHSFMADRIEKQNIRIGKFVASNNNVILNFYYTPTVLTTNSLIFNQVKMKKWWKTGFEYAKRKNIDLSDLNDLNE
jgi:NTE family protein